MVWILFSYINSFIEAENLFFYSGNFSGCVARGDLAGLADNPVRKGLSGEREGRGDPPIVGLYPDKSFSRV